MNLHLLFQILQFLVIVVVSVFLIRYIWSIFFDKDYLPVEWKHQLEDGTLSKELIRLERKYPDKVRFFNFWFQIERIKKEKITGSFAELGVYKGVTAKVIHTMAPDRKLHLFDTFEGFREKDLREETGEAATYTSENFADTSLGKVRNRIGADEFVIFHKGYFPETSKGLEDEKYAFVTLDADLYKPTREGLLYFYPRLLPGGVIIIHDYNYKWEGIKKAVDEFIATVPESLVPLPDMESSVMIIKNREMH